MQCFHRDWVLAHPGFKMQAMDRSQCGWIGGLTAAMMLLATLQCACAAAASRHVPSPPNMDAMPCCAHRSSEKSPAPTDEKPMNCPHCQQAMTLDQTPLPNVSPSFHAGTLFFSSPLLTGNHLNSPALLPLTFADSPLPMSARQRLRLRCALLF
jgi:hypothetical protein